MEYRSVRNEAHLYIDDAISDQRLEEYTYLHIGEWEGEW